LLLEGGRSEDPKEIFTEDTEENEDFSKFGFSDETSASASDGLVCSWQNHSKNPVFNNQLMKVDQQSDSERPAISGS